MRPAGRRGLYAGVLTYDMHIRRWSFCVLFVSVSARGGKNNSHNKSVRWDTKGEAAVSGLTGGFPKLIRPSGARRQSARDRFGAGVNVYTWRLTTLCSFTYNLIII